MSKADVFAIGKSSLNPFLFSDVGIEPNGLGLTILSVFARLGKDPWTEAASLALQPREAAIELLTANIQCMHVRHEPLQNSRLTAARLVKLLPTQSETTGKIAGAQSDSMIMPSWAWMTLAYIWLNLVLSLCIALAPRLEGVSEFLCVRLVRSHPALGKLL
jgi:hypothetical protein